MVHPNAAGLDFSFHVANECDLLLVALLVHCKTVKVIKMSGRTNIKFNRGKETDRNVVLLSVEDAYLVCA